MYKHVLQNFLEIKCYNYNTMLYGLVTYIYVYCLYNVQYIYVNSLLSVNVYTIFHFFKTFFFLQATTAN
jgi:hypothetical protein